MALELKIRVTQVDGDAYTYQTVADVNSELETSLQYGEGANPARNTMGLFLYVTKKEVGNDVDTLIFGAANNTDPDTAASWQVDYNEDNWFEYVLLGAIAWDSGEAGYTLNDVVFYSDALYIAVAPVQASAPGAVGGEWELVTDDHERVVANSTGNFDYKVTLNDSRLEISNVQYAKTIAESSKNGQCLNCDHDNTDVRNLLFFHINAAQAATDQQLMTQAQYNIVTLKKLYATS